MVKINEENASSDTSHYNALRDCESFNYYTNSIVLLCFFFIRKKKTISNLYWFSECRSFDQKVSVLILSLSLKFSESVCNDWKTDF